MTLRRSTHRYPGRTWIAASALGGAMLIAASALAQTTPQTEAQARARAATSALNGGPAESTLRPRVNAQPPLSDRELPPPVRPVTPPMSQATVRTPSASGSTSTAPRTTAPARPAPPQARAQTPTAPAARAPATGRVPAASPTRPPAAGATPQARAGANTRPSTSNRRPSASEPEIETNEDGAVTLAPGETAPPPIPMSLGYYVKGDLDCGQVVAGQGQIAWFTPTAFTLDFGGCEPGEFRLTGPNVWREEQKCLTELGNDAGSYTVTYEIVGPDTLKRDTLLDIDGSTESDLWHFCRPETVPSTARFSPRS